MIKNPYNPTQFIEANKEYEALIWFIGVWGCYSDGIEWDYVYRYYETKLW